MKGSSGGSSIKGTAEGFSINGDKLPLGFQLDSLDPLKKGFAKWFHIHAEEDVTKISCEGIPCGRAKRDFSSNTASGAKNTA